jgi:hypothetical protein
MLADAPRGAISEPERNSLHVIGSVDDNLPSDLSARTKHYLRLWGYGRDRSARARQQR